MYKNGWNWGWKLLLIVVGFTFLLPSAVRGSSVEREYYTQAFGWQEGYTLIITDCATIDDTHAALDYIRSMGGRIALVSPPRLMTGWIPVELSKELIGKQHIRSIHYDAMPEKEAASALGECPDLELVKFFNRVVTGEIYAAQMEAASITGKPLINDTREAPPIDRAQMEAMAEAAKKTPIKVAMGTGIKEVSSFDIPSAGAGNNDNMTGDCAVVIWPVESDGTIDANTYTWTTTHWSDTMSRLLSGLSWWVGRSWANGSPITFWYGGYTTPYTNTGYEPILHSSADDYLWWNELYDNIGVPAGTWYGRTDWLNNYYRNYWRVTWCSQTFVCYNPGSETTFTDGYFAYCYLGMLIQELYNNNGWGPSNFDKVNAHETGHIYWAGDEYYQAGYGGCGGCGKTSDGANGTRNGNCVRYGCGPGYDCIMNNNQWTLCAYTPRQLGWNEIYPRSLVVTSHGYGGNSRVKVWNTQNNTVIFNDTVFSAVGNPNGDTNVATGDVDGDGLPELICAHGRGGNSRVKVLELDGTVLFNRVVFGPGNTNGQVHVAAGDVDGDGTDEIICGQGFGTSRVKIYELGGSVIFDRRVFPGSNTNGEVNVAAGDVDGDGTDEIICAHGWLGDNRVKVLELGGTVIFNKKVFGTGLPGNPYGEVNLGVGDVDGDGDDDIICAHHQGGSSRVKVFNLQGWTLFNKKVFGPRNANGSVYVSGANVDGDVSDEIVCAMGIIAYDVSKVRIFERDGTKIWERNVFGPPNAQGEVHVTGFGGSTKGLTYGHTESLPYGSYGDKYEFWADAGATVTIFVDRLSSNHDPEFALVDRDDTTVLANVDDNVPCSIPGPFECPKVISYTLPASGVYYIYVEDSSGSVGTHWYQLYLTSESYDFASNLTLLIDDYTPEWVSPPAGSKKKEADK